MLRHDPHRSVRLSEWWQSVERDWLGVTSFPPARRIERAKWSPETQKRGTPKACPMCGHTLAPGEYLHARRRCSACVRRRFPWSRLIRLGPYIGDLRDWIHEIKFERDEAMARSLGGLLGDAVARTYPNPEDMPDVLVPVPMPFRRRIRRGVDHTALLARGAASAVDRPMITGLRRESRRPQRAVPASQRRHNIRGAFHVVKPSPLRDARVLLIDDVTTTKSTIIEAAGTLRKQAKVRDIVVAVLAVAEESASPASTGS